jgi:ATP-dependent exoDNAse (exonuclease V) alpha subunit
MLNKVLIMPGFAMTTRKAQGQTLQQVMVDLEGCTGTEAPYVMLS